MPVIDIPPLADAPGASPPLSAEEPDHLDQRPFKAAVLYQDTDASRQAAAFAVKLADGLCPGTRVEHGFWHFDLLENPAWRQSVAKDFAAADAIIVATRATTHHPDIEAWLRNTASRNCIMIFLQSSPDGNWSITIRHAAGFSLGKVGADPETVEVFRCGYRQPLRQSA